MITLDELLTKLADLPWRDTAEAKDNIARVIADEGYALAPVKDPPAAAKPVPADAGVEDGGRLFFDTYSAHRKQPWRQPDE